jgi:hypothetical protein
LHSLRRTLSACACVLAGAISLAACSLGGGASAIPNPNGYPGAQGPPIGPPAAGPPAAVPTAQTATGSTSISLWGEITTVYGPTKFLLHGNCGYENIYLNSATKVEANGLSIRSGVYAALTGTGSCSTTVTASVISLSTSPTITITGKIASVYSNSEFLLDSNCGYEDVYLNSATKTTSNGLTLRAGIYASVTGGGSCATNVTASTLTLSSSPIPIGSPSPAPGSSYRHIATWAMDEYWAQGEYASTAEVREYVSFAEGGYDNAKAATDCSGSGVCHAVFYVSPNQIQGACSTGSDTGFTNTAPESWYVHEAGYTDKEHRVQGYRTADCNGTAEQVPVYVANGDIAGTQAYFREYLQTYADNWDYVLWDATGWDVADQMYGPGGGFCGGSICSTTEELPTNASVVSEHSALANGLVHKNGAPVKIFANGNPNIAAEMSASSHFAGGMCENCVVDEGTLRTSMYATVLTYMALADATPGAEFVEYNDGASPTGSSAQIEQRLVTTAVAWLGYSEGHTIVAPNLEDNTTNLAVWPEDMLYPTDPLESMSTSPSNIAVATNVWRREFASCYDNGTAIGPCAAIVNGNGGAVTVSSTWLRQTYGHVVTLSGGDVLSGGSVSLTATAFYANSTYVPAGGALLLTR